VLLDDEGRASDSATEGNTEALVWTFRSSAHWRLYPRRPGRKSWAKRSGKVGS
jgi:hypothetical protein